MVLSQSTRKRLELKKYEETDHKIFEKLGFEELYLKSIGQVSDDWSRVQGLLRNPVARTAVDCGLLCKISIEDLAQMIPPVFQEPVTEASLKLYNKYFFDHASMTKFDWRQYLKLCSSLPYLYVRYHTALTKPKKEAMYLAGLPSKAAFADFLKNVLATAEFKFEYYSRHNNQTSDNQARAWAKVGFDAGVRYEKFSATDVADFSRTVQTSFAYEDDQIETIASDLLSEIKPPDVEMGKDLNAPVPPDPGFKKPE